MLDRSTFKFHFQMSVFEKSELEGGYSTPSFLEARRLSIIYIELYVVRPYVLYNYIRHTADSRQRHWFNVIL